MPARVIYCQSMANASKKLPWTADVYARSYIPRALLAVNDSPAAVVPPSISLEIDFSAYISTYAGSSFLDKLAEIERPQSSESISHQPNAGLSAESYGQFFDECLLLETEAQSKYGSAPVQGRHRETNDCINI